MDNSKIIWDFFQSQGLSEFGIAGLMGNLYAESSLNPKNLQYTYEKKLGMTDEEYTDAVDNGTYTDFVHDQAGYGLAQWTYWSLKDDLLEFCKEKKQSIGDLNTQLEFLKIQLSTDFPAVWKTLKEAKTILEASNSVLLKFERPADQSTTAQNKRAQYGQQYYDKYANKKSIQTSTNKGGNNMKYSKTNPPLVCMQTQSSCYKGTSKMSIKGVLWHSTAANNPSLKRYVQPSDDANDRDEMLKLLGKNSNGNDWNHSSLTVGMNAFIGKLADGTITTVQTMPWDYKPWGCASGNKGSCNNGWIQFEICEAALTDANYFKAVYKEACELTAYLCDLYNIDPKGSVNVNGVNVPTILCHADSYELGMGSNHSDVYHWFSKHNKTMEDVRNDVFELMGKSIVSTDTSSIQKETSHKIVSELYRVRKNWEDAKSQVGAYANLENAKKACDKAGKDYEVYNSQGVAIYPQEEVVKEEIILKPGDAVSFVENAVRTNGMKLPTWLLSSKAYIKEIYTDQTVSISVKIDGPTKAIVNFDQIIPYKEKEQDSSLDFTPYIVRINTDVLNVRNGAGTNYKINTQVRRYEMYTIVDEKDGWGKLKSGAGWILLDYAVKIK